MNYGLVTKITSEGSEIAVEFIEEDTNLEERFTKIHRGGVRYALSPGESSSRDCGGAMMGCNSGEAKAFQSMGDLRVTVLVIVTLDYSTMRHSRGGRVFVSFCFTKDQSEFELWISA